MPEEPVPAAAALEPLNLNTADIVEPEPVMQTPPPPRDFVRETPVPVPERRGMFGGLFGGRRRAERSERMVEPSLERPRAAAPAQAVARPLTRPPQMPAQTAPQPAPEPARRAHAQAATGTSANGQPDDLFAGVAEDDRFEIPAFLRRQAKTGS